MKKYIAIHGDCACTFSLEDLIWTEYGIEINDGYRIINNNNKKTDNIKIFELGKELK